VPEIVSALGQLGVTRHAN